MLYFELKVLLPLSYNIYMTLSVLITDFLEYLELERNTAQLTIKNYDHYLKRFLDFAGDIDPKDIDLNLVRKYRLHLSKKPLKKVTQNYFLIALRSFLRYLAKVNVETLSAEKVELRDQDPRPLKILDTLALKQLLDAPDTTKKDGIRDKAILETIFSTGLRVSELVSLNRDTINSGRWLERYLIVRKDTFKPLFIRFQGKIDPTENGEAMRLTTRSIERVVEKYVKKLGLSVKATPHTLRHLHLTGKD